MVTLNQAVAVAMVDGPRAGLALLTPLDADERMAGHHRLAAVRAHLLELAGDAGAAREAYLVAARRHHEPARAALPGGTGGPADRAGVSHVVLPFWQQSLRIARSPVTVVADARRSRHR